MIANENELRDAFNTKVQGFLVSGYSKEIYQGYLEQGAHFYVVEENDVVKGFLLAFDSESLEMTKIVNQKLHKWSSRPFIVIKQVCIERKAQRGGYGRLLYNFFIEEAKRDIYLAIVTEPLNVVSIKFHQGLGFEEAFNFVAEDGMGRAVCYKEFSDNVVDYNGEIILSQYEYAIQLYTHEDKLNWSKLNHLFYITAGLFGVFSFVINAELDVFFMYMTLAFVSVLGIFSSYLFYKTVSSGMDYMHHRKESVIELENLLEKMGGLRIVGKGAELDQRLSKSLTSLVMRRMPFLIMVIWMAIMVLIIVLGFRSVQLP